MTNYTLLPACYLPPISYFHTIHQEDIPIRIEQHENFPKQTYRTRAKIATANGILDLIVPVVHGNKDHVPMKDIRINYDHNWQRLHWLSIQTAYRRSPYFEYYEDDFQEFYDKKFDFLLDYNTSQLHLLLKLTKIQREISLTESFISYSASEKDYRTLIHPKNQTILKDQKRYCQVFGEKNEFHPDLSIIDLLFNQGPATKNYL